MKYAVRIRPAADADVDGAAVFIARDNIGAALRFYDAVERTLRQIRERPNRWPRYQLDHPRLAGLRKRSVVGFKSYLVFYLIEEEGIIDVIRVLHGARDISAVLGDDSIDP